MNSNLSDREVLKLDDLCSQLVDETISEEDHAFLESWVLESEVAREHYIKILQLSASLHEYAEEPRSEELETSVKLVTMPKRKSFFLNPLSTAAAGLLVGIFSMALARPYLDASTYLYRVYDLIVESFESGEAPLQTGLPVDFDTWSGDYSHVLEQDQGIEAVEGQKMLKIISASYEGKPEGRGFMGDLYRFVDLSKMTSLIQNNSYYLKVSAKFNHIGYKDDSQIRGLVGMLALQDFDKASLSGKQLKVLREFDIMTKEGSAKVERVVTLNEEGNEWQELTCEMLLPSDTKYVFVHFSMMDIKKQKNEQAVTFEGSYIDDIKVVLKEIPEHIL